MLRQAFSECERVGAPFASVRAGELKRVLIVHNHYKHRGGEDAVVEDECRLLTDHGIQVTSFEHSNDELDGMNLLRAGFDTVWNARIAREFDEVIGREQPGIVHVHNTFTRISPAIYWIAASRGVPVVQTLHNFRLFCPQSTFLRNGRVCENCIKQFVPVSGIRHGCYHNSKSQTFAVAAMLVAHRAIGTWRHKVTRFIALNEFCRSKFIEGGLPADKIRVKPNFVMPPSLDVSFERRGGLFVGRLSPEKGLDTLAKAVARLGHNPISVIGTGPLEGLVRSTFGESYRGQKSSGEVMEAMAEANYLVIPSIWYENFPRTMVEAFASGLPVIASRLGALAEIVDDGRTGLLFEAGNPDDLSDKISWAERNPDRMRTMGLHARTDYEQKYSPAINYEMLTDIYSEAIRASSRQAS